MERIEVNLQTGEKTVVPLTAEEIAEVESRPAPTPTAAEQMTAARAGMSQLIGTLPVESRSKFASIRTAIEMLLDLDDIEAAHFTLDAVTTDTDEEAAVKTTLLSALGQFLPS